MFNGLNVTASGGGGSFANDAFSYSEVYNGYTMQDETSLPVGQYFYYKYDDGKAWYCTLAEAISICSNKKFGLTYSTETLSALAAGFSNYYLAYTGGLPPISGVYSLANNTNTLIGWAMNNISGCKLVAPTTQGTVQIPSDTNNYLYVYVNNYIEENLHDPDYIIYVPMKSTDAKEFISVSTPNYNNVVGYMESQVSNIMTEFYYIVSSNTYGVATTHITDDYIFYASTSSNFASCVSNYGLSTSNVKVYSAEVFANRNSFNFQVKPYDIENNSNNWKLYTYDASTGNTTESSRTISNNLGMFSSAPNVSGSILADHEITIYKDLNIYTSIRNETYSPSYYHTEEYQNYNYNSEDNSSETNTTEIDNSTQNNTNIYEGSTEYFYNSTSENNYNINYENIVNNTQTIINNYYGDNNGGDNGGGDDDNDGDSGILDKLLDALIDLFKMLGKVIAAILTGIVDLITEVLAALANILSAINPFTELLSTLFGFLPDIVVNTLSAGLSICIMIAVIKFLRG